MGQEIKTVVKKKRLKKDCPCQKCYQWRFERQLKKTMSLAGRYSSRPNIQQILREQLNKVPNFHVQAEKAEEVLHVWTGPYGFNFEEIEVRAVAAEIASDIPVKIGGRK